MCNFEPVKAVKSKDKNAKFEHQITVRIAPFSAIYLTCPKHAHHTAAKKAVK